MRKILLLLILSITLFSCNEERFQKSTSNLKLRQLVNVSETEKSSSGSAFIFFATYHSQEQNIDYVKVFAEVEGSYRFLEFPIEKIRVKLDSTATNPYMVINYHYFSYKDENYSDNFVCDKNQYQVTIDDYTIVCPEQYLPKKLLPIDITK